MYRKKYSMYRVQCYPLFQAGLGTYLPWIRGDHRTTSPGIKELVGVGLNAPRGVLSLPTPWGRGYPRMKPTWRKAKLGWG